MTGWPRGGEKLVEVGPPRRDGGASSAVAPVVCDICLLRINFSENVSLCLSSFSVLSHVCECLLLLCLISPDLDMCVLREERNLFQPEISPLPPPTTSLGSLFPLPYLFP